MADHGHTQERTEQATPRRLEEARQRGHVPRSRELNTAGILIAGSVGLVLLGPPMLERMREAVATGLVLEHEQIFDSTAMLVALGDALRDIVQIIGPPMGVLLLVAVAIPFGMGGWSFSVKSVTPSLERLHPIEGLRRLFSWQGVVELIKALAKFLVVAIAASALIVYMAPQLLHLGREPLQQGLVHAGSILSISFIVLSLALIAIAAVDVPFQFWQYAKQLRMTRQEIKDELRETEGRPEVKARIRQLQNEIAQRRDSHVPSVEITASGPHTQVTPAERISAVRQVKGRLRPQRRESAGRRTYEDVAKADVVLVDAANCAVALKYDHGMNAPTVVARGVGADAVSIRRLAEQADVVVFESSPLTATLYNSVGFNQQIPTGLYEAVAQVLAYVYELRRAADSGMRLPTPPESLPVPKHLLDKIGQEGNAQDGAPSAE